LVIRIDLGIELVDSGCRVTMGNLHDKGLVAAQRSDWLANITLLARRWG